MLVIVESQEIADLINDTSNDSEYKEMMKQMIGVAKHVIGITQKSFDEALVEFLKRKDTGELPEPIKIVEEKKEIKKTTEQVAVDLFGQTLVEVRED